MATAGRTLKVALVADTKNFRSGMMSAVRDAKGFQGKMSAVAMNLRGVLGPALAGAAAAAGALAIKMGVDGVKAAIADQKTVEVLAQTLENLGQAHRKAGVEEFIAALESATGVADEELRPALGMLVTATGDVDEAQRRLKQAMDASIYSQTDLMAVTKAFTRAVATGTAGTLSRYGIIVDQNIVATEGFGVALDKAAEGIAGLTEREAKSLEGQLRILETEIGNVQEAFGYGFLRGIGDTKDGIVDFTETVRDLKPALDEAGESLGEFVKDASSVIGFVTDFKDTIGGVIDELGIFGDAVSSAFGATLNPIGATIDQVKIMSAALTGNQDALNEALGNVAETSDEAISGIAGFGTQAGMAAEETEDLVEALGALDSYLSSTKAILNYEAAWDDLRKTVKENGKQFDYSSKKGRENNQALMDYAKSTADAAAAQETLFGKVAYVQDALGNLSKLFDTTGMSRNKREQLLEPFQALLDDLAADNYEVSTLQAQIDRLRGKDVTFTVRYKFPDGRPPGGWPKEWYGAKGGEVPQYFAGGGQARGSDTIPAMLAPGEFVMRRSAVKQFGADLFSQLNRGINPLAGMTASGRGGGSGITIGSINVQAAPGERAAESLPRALRRMSFLAGV